MYSDRIFTAVALVVVFSLLLLGSSGVYSNSTTAEEETSVPLIDQKEYKVVKTATFALGCFWGPDARFGALPGVIKTRVGYAGGSKENPTYRDLGDHTESVQIDYNPEEISYEELLEVFWESHNPTVGGFNRQYMNIAFYHNEAQKEAAMESKEELGEEYEDQIRTEIRELENFYIAEDYHQKYKLKLSNLFSEEFERIYPDEKNLTDSTAAAKVNGYLSGYGSLESVRDNIGKLGLSERAQQRLLNMYE